MTRDVALIGVPSGAGACSWERNQINPKYSVADDGLLERFAESLAAAIGWVAPHSSVE